MAKFVWIASYPKSGNTWIRFLIANLLLPKVESSAQVMRQIPDIHDGVSGAHLFGKQTTLIKTHWKYWTGIPLREDTIGAIYLIRNPIDVLESNQNYALQRSGNMRREATQAELEKVAAQLVEEYISDGGHGRFRDFGIGSWEDHVRSWTWDGIHFPRLVIKYEELKSEPAMGLERICRFLQLTRSDEQIRQAVENASETAMRRLEEREIANRIEGFFYQQRNQTGLAAGHRFVGRSRSGESLFKLSDDQRRRARDRFLPLMQLFGYA
jgi:aryl sulfotransferase